jgi:hypothetical protein
MNESASTVVLEHLPFFITGPGESDILFTAVTLALVLILLGFGALYFTIQAIPDRLVEGTSKAQMQIVGILGLISLVTLNNFYWVAALLLAAIRIPDLVTPFVSMARSLKKLSISKASPPGEIPAPEEQAAVDRDPPADVEEDGQEQQREPGDD